jgi:hypothetical protein
MNLLERLERGRARVEAGWCKNYFREGGTYCALGALDFVHEDYRGPACHNGAREAGDFLAIFLSAGQEEIARESYRSKHGHEYGENPVFPQPAVGLVAEYNNAPGTTRGDILALYDLAITLAKTPSDPVERSRLDLSQVKLEVA